MSTLGNGAPAVGATDIASMQRQSDTTMMDGLSSSKVTGMMHEWKL
jgi:hypothetical protein